MDETTNKPKEIPMSRKYGKLDKDKVLEGFVHFKAGQMTGADVAKYAGSKAKSEEALEAVGCREVRKVSKRLMTDSELVDKLTALQEKLVERIGEKLNDTEELKKERVTGLSTSLGILTDKKRLLSDQSTINTAFNVKFADDQTLNDETVDI